VLRLVITLVDVLISDQARHSHGLKTLQVSVRRVAA